MTPIIELRNISVPNRIEQASVSVLGGECIHVLGENGAGKSTLLQVLAGILPPISGEVFWENTSIFDVDLSSLAATRSYHEQQAQVRFEINTDEFLAFYLAPNSIISTDVIAALEIGDLLQRPLSLLSGGELQRVMLARAVLQVWPVLQQGKGVLILDEPLQGLDIRHQHLFTAFLTQLTKAGNTVIMSCHDVNVTAHHADKVWLLKSGRIVAAGAASDMLNTHSLSSIFHCDFTVVNTQNLRFFTVTNSQ